MVMLNGGAQVAPESGGVEAMAQTILRFDDLMSANYNLSAIRPSTRLMLHIATHGPLTIKDAMRTTPLSYRAFYAMLSVMKEKGLVAVEEVQDDRRCKRLVLGQSFDNIKGSL